MGICPVGICPVGICPGVFVLVITSFSSRSIGLLFNNLYAFDRAFNC